MIEIEVDPGVVMRGVRHAGGPKSPAICLPGLTRNAADFIDLAPIVASTGRDVYRFSLRGRGASDRDPDYRNYNPVKYRDDILTALDMLEIDRAVFIGTSLGGIITMLAAAHAPDRLAAAIINDVGPAFAPEGIARIAAYTIGRANNPAGPAQSLEEAAAQIRAINDIAFPGHDDAFWRTLAERTFRRTESGWEFDYDPAIGRAIAEGGVAPDLWAGWRALAATPTLLIRGQISDLLSPAIVEEMRAARPGFAYCEAPGVGHAPFMTEPAAAEAVKEFLAAIS